MALFEKHSFFLLKGKLILYIKNSKNSKIGNIDATYAPINKTCPSSCKLKGSGCYAELSFTGIHNKRIESNSKDQSKLDLANEEADLIINNSFDNSKSKYLRLHVSGDSTTIRGTKKLAKAADFWIKNNDEYVYTYTHAWNYVKRSNWGKISVLASVESVEQISKARIAGYAPAVVVPEHLGKKAYLSSDKVTTLIPCPAQTSDVTCEQCKLCMKSDWLFKNNKGIAFAAHGIRKNKIRLNVI